MYNLVASSATELAEMAYYILSVYVLNVFVTIERALYSYIGSSSSLSPSCFYSDPEQTNCSGFFIKSEDNVEKLTIMIELVRHVL